MSREFALNELDRLFQRAAAIPFEDRAKLIERECGNREALKAELQAMLDADLRAGEFLDSSLVSHLGPARKRERIGRWILREQLGEGGHGVIYRASCEADGVTIQAAVKVLRAGLDKAVFYDRFVQERSILSGLDHPFIARLIDAGADEDGDSFLAVEYVPGRSLDCYLEESKPPLTRRLTTFIKICEAVEYLHANHVVHGDIKPGNVMVKQDGTPKLLDFGIARWTYGGPQSSRDLSRLIMTPGYASPEQVAGGGPSAAGDVYSLGCVLRDILAEVEAQSDLCAIRERCLSHSPADRYASAHEIAADVQRYLHHLPVHAYEAPVWYAGWKFIRRNRLTCALASFTAFSIVAAALLSRYDARLAALYQTQHAAVVSHLVGEQSPGQTPESSQRAVLTGSMQRVITQLEAMDPQPLSALTVAWRRLSYTQGRSGRTPQSIESIQRSIDYARRRVAIEGSPEARAELAESLLYASLLQSRRGGTRAGDYGVEAGRLVEQLPQPQRTAIEQKPEFLYALFAAARRMSQSGDVEGGRALLVRGREISRSMGKSIELRMLLDLAAYETKNGSTERVESYCAEAQSLELTNTRLENLCSDVSIDPAQRVTGLLQQVSLLERRLILDPENFSDRQHLARLRLRLAKAVAAAGDHVRAGRLLVEATALATSLVEADPRNRKLRALIRNVNRQRSAQSELITARR